MNKELNQINFNSVLVADESVNVDEYDFNRYIANNSQHKLKGFCTKCEEDACNICPSNPDYKLSLVSHGAHTSDLLQATDSTPDTSQWHNDGVLFLMESPSSDWWDFEEIEYNGHTKKPTREWWWIHQKGPAYSYPEQFVGNSYGPFFNSAIFTFKLANAYLTNIVKCGVLNSEGYYMPGNIAQKYDSKCVTNCIGNILTKEIAVLKPKIIFCFGSGVSNTLNAYWKSELGVLVTTLPHPAFQRRGFTNEFYRHLYFSIINEGLLKADIITEEEAISNSRMFLK